MPDSAIRPRELPLQWRAGNKEALHSLPPLVYGELRRVARRHLRGERANHTLQTTALIHEEYLRLMGQDAPANALNFVAITSNLMRQVLVDYARERLARKRDFGCRITLSEDIAGAEVHDADVLAVDGALDRLARLDAQQARVVELRYFGGMSIREISAVLGVSEATIKRDWATARAWLRREMQSAQTP